MIRYQMKQDIDIDKVDVESEAFCFDYPLLMDSSIAPEAPPSLPPILYLHSHIGKLEGIYLE